MNKSVKSDHRSSLGIFQEREDDLSKLWWFLLPAAAVMTTDVWFTENEHIQLISLNVTGAMMDGFFAICESRYLVSHHHSPITIILHRLSNVIRAFFLSTYTSWAGMVTFAATLSYRKGSISWGVWYMILSVVLGFLANGLGSSIAKKISKQETRTIKVTLESQVRFLINIILLLLTIYIIITYALVVTHVQDFSDVFASARYFISSGVDDRQLLIAVVCSISGAYIGNFFGNFIDAWFRQEQQSLLMGTLFCNTIFALLSLLLPILTIVDPTIWGRSLWLARFSSSFCGAASAFAGHTSDLQMLYREGNYKETVQNAIVNIGASSIVLLIAFRFEHLVAEGIREDISNEF